MDTDWSRKRLNHLLKQRSYEQVLPLPKALSDHFVYEHIPRKLIRHFAYFHATIRGGITGEFGIRDDGAHLFSVNMLIKYGGYLYGNLEVRIRTIHTFLYFQMANFLNIGGRLQWEKEDKNCYDGLELFLVSELLPFVDSVSSRPKLFRCLISNDCPTPWQGINSAARAAQIAFLGAVLGEDIQVVENILVAYSGPISASLSNEVDVIDYIDALIKESFSVTH